MTDESQILPVEEWCRWGKPFSQDMWTVYLPNSSDGYYVKVAEGYLIVHGIDQFSHVLPSRDCRLCH